MIQSYIKDILEAEIPSFEWSIEQHTGEDNTGTVLSSTPNASDLDDERDFIFPTYQVYLRSSDFRAVEHYALKVQELLDKRRQEVATKEYKNDLGDLLETRTYNVLFISCDPPIRVGVEGKRLDYSINLKTTIRRA